MNQYHAIVKFGPGYDSDTQGRMLLAFEKMMREQGIPAEVFKETMVDDSKLRSRMTIEERKKL